MFYVANQSLDPQKSIEMKIPFDISYSIIISYAFFVIILPIIKKPGIRKCSSCGQTLSHPNNFCTKCGFQVSSEILQLPNFDAFLIKKLKIRKRYFNLALVTTIFIPSLPILTMLFYSLKQFGITTLDIKANQVLTINLTAIVFLFLTALSLYLRGAKCPVCGAYVATKFCSHDNKWHDKFCRVCGT
jgi:hypothetical protein